jgi:two-component system response regulator MtrA
VCSERGAHAARTRVHDRHLVDATRRSLPRSGHPARDLAARGAPPDMIPPPASLEPLRARTPTVLMLAPEPPNDLPAMLPAFRQAGYELVVVTAFDAAVDQAQLRTPVAIIATVLTSAPSARPGSGSDGGWTLFGLRALAARAVPVIAIMPDARPEERLRAYEAGCTEVLPRLPSAEELAARVRALERLTGVPDASARMRVGRLEIDLARRLAFRNGAQVHLRPKEHDLLARLIARRGSLATRAELLVEVWGYDPTIATRTLDHHVFRLRRHIEHDPRRPELLVTVARVGYRLLHERTPIALGLTDIDAAG